MNRYAEVSLHPNSRSSQGSGRAAPSALALGEARFGSGGGTTKRDGAATLEIFRPPIPSGRRFDLLQQLAVAPPPRRKVSPARHPAPGSINLDQKLVLTASG